MCLNIDFGKTYKYLSSPNEEIIAYKELELFRKINKMKFFTPFQGKIINPLETFSFVVNLNVKEKRQARIKREQILLLSILYNEDGSLPWYNNSNLNHIQENDKYCTINGNALHLYAKEHYSKYSKLNYRNIYEPTYRHTYIFKVHIKTEDIIAVGRNYDLAVMKYTIDKNSYIKNLTKAINREL